MVNGSGASLVLIGFTILLITIVIKYEAYATGDNVGTNEVLTDLLLLSGILIFTTTLIAWITTI